MLNELALFAGAGGGILGGLLCGFRTRVAVEIDKYCRRVLLARQRDGALPEFPIWDDIKTFDGTHWRHAIDVITGGFPCQDISAAGKGAGLSGERSGLVFEMLRVVEEVRPRFVFAENSPLLRTRGLGTILKELDGLGYDARWCVLGARHVGAPHRRDRMWVLAYPNGAQLWKQPRGRERPDGKETVKLAVNGEKEHVAYANGVHGRQGRARRFAPKCARESKPERALSSVAYPNVSRPKREIRCDTREKRGGRADINAKSWWGVEPQLGRVADGVADRMDRLKAIGNGQVPQVAALAWHILTDGLL